jgi:hypothetical protein
MKTVVPAGIVTSFMFAKEFQVEELKEPIFGL